MDTRVVQKTPTLEVESRSSGFPWFQTRWVQWCTKKMISSTFSGREFNFKFSKMNGMSKIKIRNSYQIGTSNMQNDERIQILASELKSDKICSLFLAKNLSKLAKSGSLPISDIFWPKNGLNLIRFEHWGQIWNPLIILHILGTHLIWFSHFDFLTSNAFWKIWNSIRDP